MFDLPSDSNPSDKSDKPVIPEGVSFLSGDDIPDDIKDDLANKGFDFKDPNVKVFSLPPGSNMEDFKKGIKAAIKDMVEESGGQVDDISISSPPYAVEDELALVTQLAVETIHQLREKITSVFNDEFMEGRDLVQTILKYLKKGSDIPVVMDSVLLAGCSILVAITHKALPPEDVIRSLAEDNKVHYSLFSSILNALFIKEVNLLLIDKLMDSMDSMSKLRPGINFGDL